MVAKMSPVSLASVWGFSRLSVVRSVVVEFIALNPFE